MEWSHMAARVGFEPTQQLIQSSYLISNQDSSTT